MSHELIKNAHHSHNWNALVETGGLVQRLPLSFQNPGRFVVPFDVERMFHHFSSTESGPRALAQSLLADYPDADRCFRQIVEADDLKVQSRDICW